MSEAPFKRYICIYCGFIYNEAAGRPDEGIAPGTRWDQLPAHWPCPDCAVNEKADFEPMEHGTPHQTEPGGEIPLS